MSMHLGTEHTSILIAATMFFCLHTEENRHAISARSQFRTWTWVRKLVNEAKRFYLHEHELSLQSSRIPSLDHKQARTCSSYTLLVSPLGFAGWYRLVARNVAMKLTRSGRCLSLHEVLIMHTPRPTLASTRGGGLSRANTCIRLCD
jgi:hypothetical protein